MIHKIGRRTAIVTKLIIWDYECDEFHITPVLTYCSIENGQGRCIAFEWMKFAVYIGILKVR